MLRVEPAVVTGTHFVRVGYAVACGNDHCSLLVNSLCVRHLACQCSPPPLLMKFPPFRCIVTNLLSLLPASVGVVSHPTRPHLRSQQRISGGSDVLKVHRSPFLVTVLYCFWYMILLTSQSVEAAALLFIFARPVVPYPSIPFHPFHFHP